jgi:VanZ family protein
VRNPLPLLKYQSPSLLWGLFICLILLVPSNQLDSGMLFGFIQTDKAIHFVLFFVFGLLNSVGWAKYLTKYRFLFKVFVLTFITGLFLAILTEFLQFFLTNYRQASLYDIVADSIGVLLGFVSFRIIYKL